MSPNEMRCAIECTGRSLHSTCPVLPHSCHTAVGNTWVCVHVSKSMYCRFVSDVRLLYVIHRMVLRDPGRNRGRACFLKGTIEVLSCRSRCTRS